MVVLKRAGLAAVMAVLCAACVEFDLTTGAREETLMVDAVLLVGSDTAAVSLLRLSAGTYLPLAVTGARVVMESDDGATDLPERPLNALPSCFRVLNEDVDPAGGCYSALLPAPVRSGTTYALRIELPDGRVINGSAVAPERAAVEAPGAGERFPVAFRGIEDGDPYGAPILTLSIETRPITGAWRAESFVRIDSVWVGEQAYTPIEGGCSVSGRGSATRAPDFGPLALDLTAIRCSTPPATYWDSAAVSVLVQTADANYARYMAEVVEADAVLRSAAGAGIDDGAGVFGVVAITAVPVTVVCVSDQPDGPAEWFNCARRWQGAAGRTTP